MGKILIPLELGSSGFSYCMMDEHIMGTIKYFMAALKKKKKNWQASDVSSESSHMLSCPLAHGINAMLLQALFWGVQLIC